jgi:hypothetical protein
MGTLAGMAKDHVFHFRLDETDRGRLDALAAHYSAPVATVVRILVAEKFRELGLEVPPAPASASSPARPKKGAKKRP